MKTAHLTTQDSNPSFSVTGMPVPGSGPRSAVQRSSSGHAPGNVIAGKYEIVSLLGEGGMGTVWRARSLALDSEVAIKVLHCDRADRHAAERLLREARATARVRHPSIVRAFDFGETEAGEPFLVMELLEGTSLADWLDRRGRMSPVQAVQMLLPIASGLAAAHALGIVHRDIKPENIILVPDGAQTFLPKIVDFGIAKLARRGNQVITQAGMVLGSLEYMSPEQAEGKQEVGAQTDVWALCVVLYELLTGRRPFEGDSITAMIFALYTLDPPSITSFGVGDDELWAILARGLEKSPANRWNTVIDLGTALAVWASRQGTTVDASGRSLALHWLGGTPEAQDESPISWSGPAGSPSWPRVSLALIDPSAYTAAQVAAPGAHTAPRAGTIELSRLPRSVSSRRIVAVAPPRRAGTHLSRAMLGLVALPLLAAAIIYAGTGTTSAREDTVFASAPERSTGVDWPSSMPDQPTAAPAPVAAIMPQPTVAASTPSARAHQQNATPAGLVRSPAKPMPLPNTPNF